MSQGQLHEGLHLEVDSLVEVARHPCIGLLEQAGYSFHTGQDLQHASQVCCLVVIPDMHSSTHVDTHMNVTQGGCHMGGGGGVAPSNSCMHSQAHMCKHLFEQIDGQTDKQTDRQTDRQTDG